MKLGVFDSGVGGEAVAAALQRTFPEAIISTINDRTHVPYGNKVPSEVIELTDAAIQPLLTEKCDVIILACNTATALAIEWLRAHYPTQKFIGIEPMIKTAASLTRTQTIAVCATPATLASDRYAALVKKYGANLTIIEPDCSEWASWIENNQLNHAHVKQIINDACDQGADVIVLGCTHYHWIKDDVTALAAGRATVIEPSEAIGRRVQELITKIAI
jgi:glutamate racemase